MTAPTTTRSAYPAEVDDLIPQARALADELGTLPTRNKLMKTFRVGAPKAKAVLDALTADPAPAPPTEAPATPNPPPPAQNTDTPAPDDAASDNWLPDKYSGAMTSSPTTMEPIELLDSPQVAELPTAPAAHRPVTWPVLILCLPAFAAIWAGWVEMGRLTGFGKVALLPGIADNVVLDTAITLPIGVETYAAYALWVWLSGRVTADARRFAKRSAIGSLAIGAAGQVAYHLMAAAGWTSAPWPITAVVACIPVAVLGMGAALAHLMHNQSR